MPIIRSLHNRENPYVQLNKSALWDERLSLKAIGLWARCLSQKDDWRFHVSELVKRTKEGKRAIYSAIDELIEHGYCIKYQPRSADQAHLADVHYVFLEFCIQGEELEELKKSLLRCGFVHAENVLAQNSTLMKKDLNSKTDLQEETHPLPPQGGGVRASSDALKRRERTQMPTRSEVNDPEPDKGHPKRSYGGYVKLSDPEYRKLCEDHGEDQVKDLIEEMNDYILAQGKKYKDYAAALRQWFRRRVQDSSNELTPEQRRLAQKTPKERNEERNSKWMHVQLAKNREHFLPVLTIDVQGPINRSQGKGVPYWVEHETFQKEFRKLFDWKD